MYISSIQGVPMKPSQMLAQWLDKQIAQATTSQKLPTDQQLAARFSVSLRTVERMLAAYRNEGKVLRIQGKGTYIGSAIEPAGEQEVTKTSAQIIAESLTKEISQGQYRIGDALPAAKYLCLQFGVTAATVRKAYAMLLQSGLAVRLGKRLHVGSSTKEITRRKSVNEVYMFFPGSDLFAEIFESNIMFDSYCAMERELYDRGVRLQYKTYAEIPSALDSLTRHRRPIIGFHIVYPPKADIAEYLPALKRSFESKKISDCRLIFDAYKFDSKQLPSNALILARGNIQTAAARALANFITEKGYKQVNIILDETTRVWRFPGAQWNIAKIRSELHARAPQSGVKFLARPVGNASGSVEFLNRANKLTQEALLSKYEPTLLPDLASEVELISSKRPIDISKKPADLWICATSEMALPLYEQALKHKMKIPGDTAFLCLDDNPQHYPHGFSICTPDWQTIGYTMAHAHMNDLPVAKTTKGFLKMSARVIEKLTT
jgi:DNA-binding FadR family transcriptional regulator